MAISVVTGPGVGDNNRISPDTDAVFTWTVTTTQYAYKFIYKKRTDSVWIETSKIETSVQSHTIPASELDPNEQYEYALKIWPTINDTSEDYEGFFAVTSQRPAIDHIKVGGMDDLIRVVSLGDSELTSKIRVAGSSVGELDIVNTGDYAASKLRTVQVAGVVVAAAKKLELDFASYGGVHVNTGSDRYSNHNDAGYDDHADYTQDVPAHYDQPHTNNGYTEYTQADVYDQYVAYDDHINNYADTYNQHVDTGYAAYDAYNDHGDSYADTYNQHADTGYAAYNNHNDNGGYTRYSNFTDSGYDRYGNHNNSGYPRYSNFTDSGYSRYSNFGNTGYSRYSNHTDYSNYSNYSNYSDYSDYGDYSNALTTQPPKCFEENTIVYLHDGTPIKLKHVQVGDLLQGMTMNRQFVCNEVLGIEHELTNKFIRINNEYLVNAGGAHEFYVQEDVIVLKDINELEIGDELVIDEGVMPIFALDTIYESRVKTALFLSGDESYIAGPDYLVSKGSTKEALS